MNTSINSAAPCTLEACKLACVRGERRLFADIGFRLEGGELLYLQGSNGSGKTSLLRILCGLAPPATGEVRWRDTPISRHGENYRRELCYLGHQNAIKEELTPLENLLSAARIADQALDADTALDALQTFGLSGHEELACRYLSQGQKRRVALARLCYERRTLWILDEPFVALDSAAIALLSSLIAAHLQRGGLVVLTTHQTVNVTAGAIHQLRLD